MEADFHGPNSRCVSCPCVFGFGHASFRMWGVERLSVSKKAEKRKAGNNRVPARGEARERKRGKKVDGSISRALRSVYDDTLREEVPADFIDLLGRLG